MRLELEHRPLLLAFAGLLVGMTASHLWWNAVFILPFVLLPLTRTKRVLPLVAAVGGFWIAPDLQQHENLNTFFEGEARVVTMPRTVGEKFRAEVKTDQGRFVAYFDERMGVSLGDKLTMRANVLPLTEGPQPAGLVGRYDVISVELVSRGNFIWRMALTVRSSFLRFLEGDPDPETKSLIASMCFNLTSGLDSDDWHELRASGTTHIVSTSGLHVLIAGFALLFLLTKSELPRPLQIVLLLVCLLLYGGAAGLRPPIIRAIVMIGVALSAYLFRKGVDLISALSLAGLITLILSPWTAFSIGFQLSMAAVLSLILFGGDVRQSYEGWSGLRIVGEAVKGFAKTAMIVSVAISPLIAYHFGDVPLYSVLANVLIVPFLSVAIIGSLGSWFASWFSSSAGLAILTTVVKPFVMWIDMVIGWTANLPYSTIAFPQFSAYWLVIWYGAFLVLWRPRVRQSP